MKRFSIRFKLFVVIAMLGLVAIVLHAASGPSWWVDSGVVKTNSTPSDFAPVNQGQLKWMAVNAAVALDAGWSAGAGSNVWAFINSLSNTNNYRVANLGQVKYVARPIYDRLMQLGYCTNYPWSSSTNAAHDYAVANIGQVKNLFNFDAANINNFDNNRSTVGDGIPDWWKLKYGLSTTDPNVAGADPDHDGYSNLQEYLAGTNPTNSTSHPFPNALTIPNAWAAYVTSNQVVIVADIRSTNTTVTVAGAEYCLSAVMPTNGAGIAMSATNGTFNSTNIIATATFTPTFPYGSRHVIYLHARGSNGGWSPYQPVILNPNVNDILNKIQTNYSAFQDLQFTMTITETGADDTSPKTGLVRMKGPYKLRTDYDSGMVAVRNENNSWWHNDALGVGGALTSAINGDTTAANNRVSDFFWDVPLFQSRTVATISNSLNSVTFNLLLTPNANSVAPFLQQTQTDFRSGLVLILSKSVGYTTLTSEFLNPIEVFPGHWLFTGHRYTMQFGDGTTIIKQTTITGIIANQGLDDSLFDIPTN